MNPNLKYLIHSSLSKKYLPLCQEYHDFLIKTNNHPFEMAGVHEMSWHENGGQLLNKIYKQTGGLKKFKPYYYDYLANRYIRSQATINP